MPVWQPAYIGLGSNLSDPAAQVRAIEGELQRFDPELLARPRWLVLNKMDLVAPEQRESLAGGIVERLQWSAPWFAISAANREGTREVTLAAQRFFDEQKAQAAEPGE